MPARSPARELNEANFIRSSARQNSVKSREPEIKAAENFFFISKFCSVTYLDFLHARIITMALQIKNFRGKLQVQFSLNYKTPFFDVS